MNVSLENAAKTGSRKRILVVDDEPEVTDVLIRILKGNGFEAWAANNPLETLERAKAIRPDLILLDFDMPKLLGPEVSVVLKSSSETRDIPIVFLSGMTDEDHHAIGALSGAAAYLAKPIDQVKLIETIRAVLGSHHPPR